MKKKPTPKNEENAELNAAIQALDDKKAAEITVLDLEDKSSIARYFVIATATSQPHIRGLRNELEKVWEKTFARKLKHEWNSESNWQVVDLGDILIHLFTSEERARFNLEGLWGDAKMMRMSA
jgi:ribosome-associated protein